MLVHLGSRRWHVEDRHVGNASMLPTYTIANPRQAIMTVAAHVVQGQHNEAATQTAPY